VELSSTVVVVIFYASPGGAAHAGTLNSVQCGGTTAVSVSLDPVDFNAPISSCFSAITVVRLTEV
jgi:hypothetical protein